MLHAHVCTSHDSSSTASSRNVVDVSVSTHRVGALTTATNPANEMIKQGRGGGGGGGEEGDHEYELVDVSLGVGPLTAKAGYKTYKIPFLPSQQPLPTIPLSVVSLPAGVVGVAKQREEEGVYENIPRDQ